MSPSSFASVYIKDPKAVDLVGIAVDDTDQSRGYHSVVVVKADSPYKKLEDLKGKSFGFADPDSTSGFLVPNQVFKKQFGGTPDNKYNNFFSSVTFSGGHEQDVLGVLNGQFEGAVTWASMIGDYNTGYTSGAFNRMIRMDHPDLMKQIRIIWQSPLIPNGPILVSNSCLRSSKPRWLPPSRSWIPTTISALSRRWAASSTLATSSWRNTRPLSI